MKLYHFECDVSYVLRYHLVCNIILSYSSIIFTTSTGCVGATLVQISIKTDLNFSFYRDFKFEYCLSTLCIVTSCGKMSK